MHLQFDYEVCTKCGLCAKVCGSKCIDIDENKQPYEASHIICNDCGHCMAVCPTNAVNNTRMESQQFLEMQDPEISFDQFYHLIRNRRSIRIFQNKPLEPAHVNHLLESVRYIPTGSNTQALKYAVISDPNVLQDIKKAMAKKFRMANNLVQYTPVGWFIKKKDRSSFRALSDLWECQDRTRFCEMPPLF